MASNSLYIYDPEEGKAVCIASGFDVGWDAYRGDRSYIAKWLDETQEPVVGINCSRLVIRTEGDLPKNTEVTYQPEPSEDDINHQGWGKTLHGNLKVLKSIDTQYEKRWK